MPFPSLGTKGKSAFRRLNAKGVKKKVKKTMGSAAKTAAFLLLTVLLLKSSGVGEEKLFRVGRIIEEKVGSVLEWIA